VAGSGAFLPLLEAFLESRRVKGDSPQGARRSLTRFFAFLRRQGIRDLRLVREAEVLAFLREERTLTNRFGRPTSLDQLAKVVGALRGFFAFLARSRKVLVSPARDLRLPRVERLPRTVLSLSEASRLMAAPETGARRRDRALLETLYGTGIRLNECVRLDLTDLDIREGTLLVRNGKGRRTESFRSWVAPFPLSTAT
jgi:integrase/recombinase XerD